MVVPCLNRAGYLAQTIDSILAQDYQHLECVVVDGGSTDGSVDLLRSYGESVRWVSEPDRGHADAINKGWQMSRGTILAWLNADDVYVAVDAVSQIVTYLNEHPDVGAVYGDYVELDAGGAVISERIQPLPWDLTYAVAYCDHIIPQASSFMRRSILERVGWLDPEFRYCKDHELWLRLGLAGVVVHVPILVAGVRVMPGISQHLETSWAKVALTEKFLSRGDLPEPLSLRRFRQRALSNAWLVGGFYALNNGFTRAALAFFGRAVAADVGNLPYITFRLLQYAASFVLPVRARQAVKRAMVRAGMVDRLHRLPGAGGQTALRRKWY
ncbi:MAG TPA: glycosyltransferase family 2 protein [bacterium]|nr:glycosyltransferase family 2 protein [bacterium]